MIEALVATKWIGTGTLGDPQRPALGDEVAGLDYEDMTGQHSARVGLAPRLVILKVRIPDARLAEVQGDARQQVIAWRRIDDATGVEISENHSANLTSPQATQMRGWLTARGVAAPDAAVVTAGISRLQAAKRVIQALGGRDD